MSGVGDNWNRNGENKTNKKKNMNKKNNDGEAKVNNSYEVGLFG